MYVQQIAKTRRTFRVWDHQKYYRYASNRINMREDSFKNIPREFIGIPALYIRREPLKPSSKATKAQTLRTLESRR